MYNIWLENCLESAITGIPNKLEQLIKSSNYLKQKLDSGNENLDNAVTMCVIDHALLQQDIAVHITILRSLLILTEGDK